MTTTPPPSMIARMAVAMQHTSAGQPFSWENAARAALGELRNPTDEMVAAGAKHLATDAEFWTIRMQAQNVYQLAIDAALAEAQ